MSAVLFLGVRTSVFHSSHPIERGFLFLPFIYALTTAANVVSIFTDAPPCTLFVFRAVGSRRPTD
ncbi:unnamed protein product [Darwinula stevensoni]|uniref:Uncharacterized protein n=1 Tax=Darwinula stevensoni TaxID=69355 RepID=A0A7R9ABB0_9CRUS|nr:unnamed protein product [Darwinula stevensoni]CAG0898973.1 unnamed protein product [Darwinula stevensoni]